ncbi:hypothetical protein BCR35DRAFT_151825 [Leucosporidium creatinivorum]|uniref:BZIP domain-containing protein n=1 Tax=Leucosporidium creatinivorum TaxID=106004 RepID=A0A1Y2ENH4_9BASI|nr:hypothetical protein BCR35DRAFT_151825 [Leucosporidium creatinivorum]
MSAGSGSAGPPSFASFTFANRGEPSPRTPGSNGNSPWSSFLRSSPGLWTSGVRSNSLPPTPSELRSTLGREENPFSAAFSVNALPSSHLDLEKAGDNDQQAEDRVTGDGTAAGTEGKQGGKKRALSVSSLEQLTDKEGGAAEEKAGPSAKRPFAFDGEGGARPEAEQRLSFSTSDPNPGSDFKRTPSTPNTSVEPSPKSSLFDQLNASIPSEFSSHNYYQPAPRPIMLPHTGDTILALHPPSVVSPPLPPPPPFKHQPFSFDKYSLQSTSPAPLPSPPLAKHPEVARDRRLSAPQPHAPTEPPTAATGDRPPPLQHAPSNSTSNPKPSLPPPPVPAAVTVVPGPKKRGRKPKDPNAPVDQEQVAKARLSALERNRIAASKSRAKKKEKAANAESAVADLSASNAQLQATALSLRAELLALRQQVDTFHPDQSRCTCEHIKGYLHREATGGGIPTLDRLAGETLTRDYESHVALGRDEMGFEGMARSESGDPEVEEREEQPAPSEASAEAPVEGRVAIPIRRSVRG